MSFPFVAGRSLRQLHQTVNRNILRQHRRNVRYESSNPPSKSTSSRNASTVAAKKPSAAAYWAWVEPIKAPFRAYSNMQKRSPLLTQWESTLVIYFLGDLSAQTVQTSAYTEGPYEPIRGLRALVIAGVCSIPIYKWFLWLGRHFNYAAHWKSLAVKIMISQMVFTPVFNTYFFGMQTLLSGGSLKEAAERVIHTVPVSWANSWKFWPIVTAFTFTYIPPHNRSVFTGIFAIGWQTYLSWLNKLAEDMEKKEHHKGEAVKEEATKTLQQAAAS